MFANRRKFLSQTAGASLFGCIPPAFAVQNAPSLDSDPTHIQSLSKKLGNFDRGFTEELTHQLQWTYSQ